MSDFPPEHEQQTTDPLAGPPGVGDDPFAETPSGLDEQPPLDDSDAPAPPEDPEWLEDPEAGALAQPPAEDEPPEDLPPGVEPGALGGVNPSEEAASVAGPEDDPENETLGEELPPPAEDPLAPGGDADPPEPATPVAEEKAGDAPVPGAEDPPPPVEDDDPPPAEDSPSDPLAEEEPQPGAEPEDDDPPADPPQNGNGSAKSKPRRRRKDSKKPGPGERTYTIFREVKAERVEAIGEEPEKFWDLEFEVVARSSELALRKAYRKLSENTEAEYTLAAVPTKYFKPVPVKGKVPDAALAIKVG